MPLPDLVAAAFHWLEYIGLLVAIGSLVVRRLARLAPRIEWAEPPPAVIAAGAVAGAIGLLETWPPRSVLIGGVHLVGAGVWAGGILAMATLRPPGGWRAPEAAVLIDRFARVAPIAFAVTALTGVIRATERLSALGDLWMTPYGMVLDLKCFAVLAMLALSIAWRRGLPAARGEAFVAVAVAGATALLAAFPAPA